jgi:peptidoglycan/LPS O-acetylase OafA/YrhL
MTRSAVAESSGRSAATYRPDIDGLRAVAVLAVVLFHAGIPSFGGGFVGVDIFFVISGFLITRIVRDSVARGEFSFARFYLRRIRRLFPALVATIVASFVAAAVFFSPDLLRVFGASSAAAVFSTANVYFWLNSGYFDPASSLNPLLHTWSLSVEEQFYLVWPLILLVASRRRAALPVLVALMVASIIGGLLFQTDPSGVFYLMPFRVFELAIGGIMVWVVERVIVPPLAREVVLVIGLAMIGVAVLTFRAATPFPVNGLVPCLGAGLVILCGTAHRVGLILRNRLSVAIGLISYSVYLVHWPIGVFYQYVVGRELGDNERVAMVLLALAAGLLLNLLVEKRFRYVRPTSWRPRRFAQACGAVAAVTAVVGLQAAATGWTWRLGARESTYVDIRTFYGGAQCTSPRCESGAGEPLIVIGDSHALAYFAGMRRDLPDRRLIFFESSACPFFSPDKTRDYGAALAQYDQPCRSTRRLAFDEIRVSGADVVVAQNWFRMDMVSEVTTDRWVFTTDAGWARFVGEELSQLKADLGIQTLVVIGNVPTPGGLISPVDCIARPVRLNDVGCSATPRDNPKLAIRALFNARLRISVGPFAWFVDPYDYLCDASECANFRDGLPLYTNETHLSESGSTLVVDGILSTAHDNALSH